MLTVTSPQTVDQELGFKGKSTDTKPTHYWNGQAIPNASTLMPTIAMLALKEQIMLEH